MQLTDASALVPGGASGLGRATVARLVEAGVPTVLADLPSSDGKQVAESFGRLVTFAPADVTDAEQITGVVLAATERAPLRAVIHCAGIGRTVRVVGREGEPGSMEDFETVVRVNLLGSFNVLRIAAAEMAKNQPEDGERGVVVMTALVAAWEGQIGQVPYSAYKAGFVRMTIVAARDLARRQIRVNTIAPGIFETPVLDRHPAARVESLAARIPHPSRLGRPDEYAKLAMHILDNSMINGETIRIDGALRMAPK